MNEISTPQTEPKPLRLPDPQAQPTTTIARGDFRRKVARDVFAEAVVTLGYVAVGCAALGVYASLVWAALTALWTDPHPFWIMMAVFLVLFGVALTGMVVKSLRKYRARIGMGR